MTRPSGKRQAILAALGLFVAVSVALAVTGLLLPALARTGSGHGRRDVCRGNLSQVGKGCLAYANDHKGPMPGRLKDLFPQYLDEPLVLACPSSAGPGEAGQGLPSSYRYVGVLDFRAATPGTIIAYELSDNHGGGRYALFYDGHAAWMPEAELRTELARNLKMLEEAYRKGLIPFVPE